MKPIIQAMAHQGLRQLGTIRQSFTYTQIASSEYDVDTGTVVTTTTTAQVVGVLTDYRRWEINLAGGQIQKEDRKLLITPRDFRQITPQVKDTVTTRDGEIYVICEDGIGLDPAQALYVMQVRKISGE